MNRFTSYVLSLIVAGLTFVSTSAEAYNLKERLSKRTRPEMQVLGSNTLKPLQFQMEKAGMPIAKKGMPMRAPQQTAHLQSHAWGFIEGPDGLWTYTQTFESANYYYTKSDITLYNSKHQQVGQISINIPDGKKVNAIQPMNLVTNKLFDKDADTYEVAIYMHEVGEFDQNSMMAEQIYKTKVFSTDGTEVYECNGLGMFVDMQLNEWTRYQRLVNVLDPNDYDTLTIDIIAPPGGQKEPFVEKTFKIPFELTNYSDGGYISVAQIDNQPYYVISHYEKPWAEDYDLTTFDPIPTPDNNYILKVYNRNFKMVDSLSVPVEKSEEALYRFVSFGLMSNKDLSKNYFSNDGNLNFVISYYEYMTSSDSYVYNFVVVDNKGKEIKTVCENVSSTYFELSDIEGHESQMAFMQQIGDKQQISMVDLPSCNVAAVVPAELHGEQISTTLDRYPKGDSYQYVISMGSAIGDANDNVIARIGWYNKDLSFDHFTSFNLGPYGQMFNPLIDSDGLNPYLFDTDDDHEFAYIAKIGNPLNSKLDNTLYIANEDGSVIEKFVGNKNVGDLITVMPINTYGSNPELAVFYYSYESDVYDMNYYKLPFTKFQGGKGTIDNPYLIATVGDLQQMKGDLDGCYKLVADIDMSKMPTAWTPLNGFNGKLDGDGHSISNLVINTKLTEVGLFGNMAEGGSVRNLTFVNPTIKVNEGNAYVGIIAGTAMTDTLQNVHVYGANIIDASGEADITVGGLVGQSTVYGEISSCSFNGTINTPAASAVGGIAGDTRTATFVFSSKASGNFTGESNVGGIVGTTGTDGQVFDCHVNADLTALNTIGGIIGSNGSRAGVNRNYAVGTIKALKSSWKGFAAGGILGHIESDWTQKDSVIISGNVSQMDIILPKGTTSMKGVNRIVGYTIADEEYMPGEKRLKEIGMANNYATASVKVNGKTITSDDDKSVNGASKEAADYNKDFFTAIGYVYGTTAAEPWKGEKGMPVLYFENEAAAITMDSEKIITAPGVERKLVITVYGTDASEINVTSSNTEVAAVEIVEETDNSITISITSKQEGTAVITATAGNCTATCEVISSAAAGIEGIESSTSNGIEEVFNTNGVRLNSLQKGMNIVRMRDGRVKKVVM